MAQPKAEQGSKGFPVNFLRGSLLTPNAPLGPRQTNADPVNFYTERLNGRMAMVGLAIGVTVEALTGKGILDQVFGLFS